MLLHKLYINVAIRHILMYARSLYDPPSRKCKNHRNYELRQAKKPFFSHISENKQYKVYVAS